MAKLPPIETYREKLARCKDVEKEIKRAKKKAKKEVRSGEQATINHFWGKK